MSEEAKIVIVDSEPKLTAATLKQKLSLAGTLASLEEIAGEGCIERALRSSSIHLSGTRTCGCGKLISATKQRCKACSEA